MSAWSALLLGLLIGGSVAFVITAILYAATREDRAREEARHAERTVR